MPAWASGNSGTVASSFRTTHHAEQSWFYWQQLPNGEGLDHWFWGRALRAGSSRDFPFTLHQVVDTGQSVTLRLTLQGETDPPQNPDHTTRVSLNGTLLGEIHWDGQVPLSHAFSGLSATLLQEGTNTLSVTEVSDPNILADSVYVNHIEVDYDRVLAARNDQLAFQLTGPASVTVTNFSSNQVQVFDITDPAQPQRLSNPVITSAGATFSVQFATAIQGDHRYLAIAVPAIITPTLSFQSNAPDLRNPANGADYLVITHDSLSAAVAPLAQHRAGQGYRVKIVTTQAIFDAFSDGIFTPQAIKDFLGYAYHNWQAPSPKFVVLIGDANLDYKDNYHTGQINLVPTHLVETVAIGETPSDNWFVTVAGNDLLPDMNIGRIPAKTSNDVRIITNKLIAYDQGMAGDWSSRILVATGDQDPRFESFAREWLNHVPASITTTLINPGNSDRKFLLRGAFSQALNDKGVGLVTYFGHGQVNRWVASNSDGTPGGDVLELISSRDAAKLSNFRAFPFFVAFNCLNGLFAEPNEGKAIQLPDGTAIKFSVPLPEALLFREDAGAIGMWSPAAFAFPSEQRSIGEELFAGIYEKKITTLGVVTTQAKVNAVVKKGIDANNLDVFTFIGDPATRLVVTATVTSSTSSSGGAPSGGGGGGMMGLFSLFFLAARRFQALIFRAS